jgi:hypothetical protein
VFTIFAFKECNFHGFYNFLFVLIDKPQNHTTILFYNEKTFHGFLLAFKNGWWLYGLGQPSFFEQFLKIPQKKN